MQASDQPTLRDIVLVGGGHSHVGVLRRFAMRPQPGVRLNLICSDSHTPYSGMLPGYIAGHYGYDEVHIDLDRLCVFAGARMFRAEAIGIDRAAQRVLCRDRPPIAYDLLSINIGSTPQMQQVAGAEKYAVPVKPIRQFNQRWLALLERVRFLAGDVSDAAVVRSAVEEVEARSGGLDVLVNNAGISTRGTIESTDEGMWDLTLEVNLKGAWLGIKALLPLLRKRKGTIINIGSTRATRPMPGLFPYVISKAGLWGLTRQVANELLHEGITCNMVAPGWVDTENERKIQARYGRPDFPAGIRNLTTPADVGAMVAFLASPPGRRINGDILYVDSGLHVADDAGMVHLPDRVKPPFEQRIDES